MFSIVIDWQTRLYAGIESGCAQRRGSLYMSYILCAECEIWISHGNDMMIIVLWNVTSRNLEYRSQRLGGTCFFHLQGTLTSHPNNNTSPPFLMTTNHRTSVLQEKQKNVLQDTLFSFIADWLLEQSEWRHYYFDSSYILFVIKMKLYWKYPFCFSSVIDALWLPPFYNM